MDSLKISPDQLQNGDVLLYEHKRHISFFALAIRIITGSKFVHSSIIINKSNNKFVLEQLSIRSHCFLPFYYAFPGEIIHAVRPFFPVPEIDNSYFNREGYGYRNIIDSLINHTVGLIFKNWKYIPFISVHSTKDNCSVLIAKILKLSTNAIWCKFPEVVEPDDYFNHSESFHYLGVVDWKDANTSNS